MASNDPPTSVTNDESIEVEKVDEETFDILDNVTDLGTLDAEYSETKRKLALRKNNGQYVPQDLFKGSTSVSVSDISSSLWCELQVEYRYLHPYMSTTSEWARRNAEGRPVEKRTKQMLQGSSIHYQREIEIRQPVKVVTVTNEDRCAVDLINTLVKLHSVHQGNIEREIKLLGKVFGCNILLSGVIDQVQYIASDRSLVIQELKTRKSKSLPEGAQKQGNYLQVNIYKMLLDSFTHGFNDYTELLRQRGLNVGLPLSTGPVHYLNETKLIDCFDQSNTPVTLEQLAVSICEFVKGLCLPLVDSMLVQYVYQENREVLGTENVACDEEWARKMVQSASQYWKGERDAQGVDIEDSWKCEYCQFKEVCVWRKKQIMETSPVKKWPEEFYQPSPKRIAL